MADQRSLARLQEAAPDWMPAERLRWLGDTAATTPITPPSRAASLWRYACCHGCVAALLVPSRRDEVFAEAVRSVVASDAGECDPLLARALAASAWLLALKRMRAPGASDEPALAPDQLRQLGLGAAGLVEAIAGLGDAVDHGRRLARAAREYAEARRRANRRGV